MLKLGSVLFKKLNESFSIVWIDSTDGAERIDIYKVPAEYKVTMPTESCTSAYYSRRTTYYYGNEELIRTVQATKHMVLSAGGKTETKLDMSSGKIKLVQEKVMKSVDLKCIITMYDGALESEIYETVDCKIVLDNINAKQNLCPEPVDISSFTQYALSTGKRVDTSNAEFYPLSYLKATYPIEHIEDNDFVVVKSMEEAKQRLEAFKVAPTKIKAIDVETTGTDIGIYGKDFITGVVLSWSTTESTYYPFRQKGCSYNLPIEFIGEILNVVNNQPDDVKIVTYNGKFEKQAFWKENPCYLRHSSLIGDFCDVSKLPVLPTYELRIDADAYFLSVLLNPKQAKGLHTLKSEAFVADGKFYLELSNIFKDKKNIRFDVLTPDIIRYYACPDTANTIKVYVRLLALLPKDEFAVFELENQMLRVTAINEFYGLRANVELLQEKYDNEIYKVQLLGDTFRNMHRTTKNINSADVRRDIIYNKLRCPVLVRTKTFQPSTSKEAIKQIIEDGTIRDYDEENVPEDIVDTYGNPIVKGVSLASNRYPSLVILQEYAKVQKESGAYKRLLSKLERDRIVFYLNQVGAGSGRQTSDAHQYSDGMKEVIVADSNHHYLWSSDYKQVELRILAYIAGQQDLIELEKDPSVDIHRAIASIILQKEMWAITAKERKKNKSVNFGIVYLMSAYGLAKRLYGPKYTDEELISCVDAITDFYNGMPYVKQYIEHNKEFVKREGYIATQMGRRRLFPEVFNPTITKREMSVIERAANNTPIQGFGADLLKRAEVNIDSYIRMKGWDELIDCDGVMLPKVRIMLSIHDEVLLSSHESVPIEEIITMFKVCMEINVKGAPPFYSAPAMVPNWYAGKNAVYEVDLLFRDKVIDEWKKGNRILHVESYVDDLNAYRSERLNEYMDGLISEYKTVEEVSKHVRHPELTHTLLEVYLGEKEVGKKQHEEEIYEATRRYMEGAKKKQEIGDSKTQEANEDESIKLSFSKSVESYTYTDQTGELILEEIEDAFEEVDKDMNTVDDTPVDAIDILPSRKGHVQFTMKEALIDLNGCETLQYAEPIRIAIDKLGREDAFYRVVYVYKGKIAPTSTLIDYKDKVAVEDIFTRFEKGELYVTG